MNMKLWKICANYISLGEGVLLSLSRNYVQARWDISLITQMGEKVAFAFACQNIQSAKRDSIIFYDFAINPTLLAAAADIYSSSFMCEKCQASDIH